MNNELLQKTIAKNIIELRHASNMTQSDLAEKLGYSDKSVSKWERAEGVPDVICLKNIADLFGVTVDYLLSDDHCVHTIAPSAPPTSTLQPSGINHRVIAILAISSVWLLAGVIFLVLKLLGHTVPLVFPLALFASAILGVIFNALWGNRKYAFFLIDTLVISALFLVCCIFSNHNPWLLMTLSAPATVVVWLACRIKRHRTTNAE